MAINYRAPIEIRDSRNGSWFWIHTHVWRDDNLTQSSKVVYGTIASYANTEQTAFPSITKIALDSHISERHVYRCLKELERFNYLKVERKHGKPNLYTLVKTTSNTDVLSTPDIMSPLTYSHPTPDKLTSTTPDKSAVRTRTNEQELINNIKILDSVPTAKDKKFSLENEIKNIDSGDRIRTEYQFLGLEIWGKLHAPENKKGSFIRVVRDENAGLVNEAYHFAKNYPVANVKWKVFFKHIYNAKQKLKRVNP